jgi:hypothetical protein
MDQHMIQSNSISRGNVSRREYANRDAYLDPEFNGAPDPIRVSIAQLTDLEIDRMEEHDLFDVIEMADIRPVDRRLLRSLEFRKIADLKRIVLATRTACRDYWLRAKRIAEARANEGGRSQTAGEATVDFMLRS